MTIQDALLARERNVVEVLVERDLDPERQRVAPADGSALRARSGLDAATAPADVFLLLHLDQPILDLDQIDHLGRLELSLHRLKVAATARTRAVGAVELEHLLDHGQPRLLGRPRLLTWLAFRAAGLGLRGRRT